MPDYRNILNELDCNKIKAALGVIDFVPEEISLSGLPDLLSLAKGDCLFGLAELFRPSCLHFNEHQHSAVVGNDIDLSMLEAKVPLENTITLLNQKINREVLAVPPALLVVPGHGLLLPPVWAW